MRVKVAGRTIEISSRYREILVCALVGSLGILVLDVLTLRYGVYYSDDVNVLYPVAIQSLMTGSKGNPTRPLEYIIVLIANKIYLPLWLGASLLCVVGATILSALACEFLFERQLPKSGWWILGLANPLLLCLISQPDTVSQALCNLLFAGVMLALFPEFHRLPNQRSSGWRADRVAILLNVMAAALFFTKETAVAAAIIIPCVLSLIRLKSQRLSWIFFCSLLLPIGAFSVWIWLKLKFPLMLPTEEGRYGLKLDPIVWVQNFIVTLGFPLTPLPSSFIEFTLLKPLWIATMLGSVAMFLGVIAYECFRNSRIIWPLLFVAASCAPMILIRTDELYPTMIAPFMLSIVLLFGLPRMRRLSLAYALLLYIASLGNGIIYYLGSDLDLGLQRLGYSIYSDGYQFYPICPIGTAHIGWDGTAAGELPYGPAHVKGRITCLQ
jgi:hypothetical protein